MIINIPLQIDETVVQGALSNEYKQKVIDYLATEVNNYILSECDWRNRANLNDGIRVIVNRNVREFIDAHADEIIAEAGKVLAEKLVKTKKAKELIPELAEIKNNLSNGELIDILSKQNLDGIEE